MQSKGETQINKGVVLPTNVDLLGGLDGLQHVSVLVCLCVHPLILSGTMWQDMDSI